MARYIIAETANFTSVSAWKLVDSTSFMSNDSEGNSNGLTTSYVNSTTWTWGSSVTVDGVAVKLAFRGGTATSNQIYVAIRDSAGTSTIAGTEVVGNVSEFPAASNTLNDGGWYFFKFASPVTISSGTYRLGARLSSTTTAVSLWRNSVTSNDWSRMVRTTTELGSLTAGDDFHVMGYFDMANASGGIAPFVSTTVTLNNTGSTDFGAGSTTITTPSFSINRGSTLALQTTASTNYQLKLSGTAVVYNGGTVQFGTSGTPLPDTSTFLMTFDSAAQGGYGITFKKGATFIAQGASKKSWCWLDGDHTSGVTTINVTDATGWKIGDVIVIGTTVATVSSFSRVTISGITGNTLTTDATSFAHLGTAPIIAPVGNCSRNITISGVTTTNTGYWSMSADSTITCYYVEFKFMGGTNSSFKRGLDLVLPVTTDIRYCSFHQGTSTTTYGIFMASGSGSTVQVRDCVANDLGIGWTNGSSTTVQEWDGNLVIRTTASNSAVAWGDTGSIYRNNVVNGSTHIGISLSEASIIGEFDNNQVMSATFASFNTGAVGGSMSNLKSVFGRAPLEGTFGNITITNFETLGCTGGDGFEFSSLNSATGALGMTFKNVTTNGATSQSTTNGFNIGNATVQATFENSSFGVVGAGKTAHTNMFNIGATAQKMELTFIDCIFNSTGSFIVNQTNIGQYGWIKIHNYNQTEGDHRYYDGCCSQLVDSAIQESGNNTWKIIPIAGSSWKSESISVLKVQMPSGTTKTIGVKVRESVSGDGQDYVGDRIRLMCRRNPAAGISTNQVVATATVSSEGSWETISGTSPAVSENTVLEFYVDGKVTSGSGWFNQGEWSVT